MKKRHRVGTNMVPTLWILGVVLFVLAVPPGGLTLAAGLNDTGIQFCGEAEDGNNEPCIGSEPAGQDAQYGRDAAAAAGMLTKVGGGEAGFDYTKIANNGAVLPASAALGSGPNDWACTRDNVTGLTWEVKTDDSGFRDKDWTYTWYDSHSPDGNPGKVGTTSTCSDTLGGENCNTEHYVDAVNNGGLCGHTDWRMPTVKELHGIVDFGRVNPAIDSAYFPYTTSSYFWSSSPYVKGVYVAWVVSFYDGNATGYYRSAKVHVRLVRGGQ